MITVGSKCRLKGKLIKGVSFRVVSINKWGQCDIKHSVSFVVYTVHISELELIKCNTQ